MLTVESLLCKVELFVPFLNDGCHTVIKCCPDIKNEEDSQSNFKNNQWNAALAAWTVKTIL